MKQDLPPFHAPPLSRGVNIRELHAMNDLLETVALQKDVWGMRDHECTSPHTMKAATVAGGSVLGAAIEDRLIGFCFGMAAKRGDEVWLWSHMTAVHPDYQRGGIGFALKQAQREWALANGYRVMAWTFDPMQAGNANFNLNRLGATARLYYVNHYGAMQDELNAGLASDRLEAQWQLDSSKVMAMAAGDWRPSKADWPGALTMALMEKGGKLHYRQPATDGSPHFGVEIPAYVTDLKRHDKGRAGQWQQYARAAITELLAQGYIISGLQRQGEKVWYILSREN